MRYLLMGCGAIGTQEYLVIDTKTWEYLSIK